MKAVYDIIYGLMEFPDIVWQIIDHPLFQRLDRVRQCGIISQVYPCATHTRKAHSLGVAFLARKWANHLKSCYDGIITEKDILNITIAGLCHDIGHGPFSHLFDHMMKYMKHKSSHESRSIKYLENINNDLALGLDVDEIALMILGRKGSRPAPAFLYQIVSNSINGLDADRLDYLSRDSYYTIHLVDQTLPMRIIHNSLLDSKGDIIFKQKIADDVLHLYKSRYDMFNRVYCHKTVMKLEAVLLCAFKHFYLDEDTSAPKKVDDSEIALCDDLTLLDIMRKNPRSASIIKNFYDKRNFLPEGDNAYTLNIRYTSSGNNPLDKVKFVNKQNELVYICSNIIDMPTKFKTTRTVKFSEGDLLHCPNNDTDQQ